MSYYYRSVCAHMVQSIQIRITIILLPLHHYSLWHRHVSFPYQLKFSIRKSFRKPRPRLYIYRRVYISTTLYICIYLHTIRVCAPECRRVSYNIVFDFFSLSKDRDNYFYVIHIDFNITTDNLHFNNAFNDYIYIALKIEYLQ